MTRRDCLLHAQGCVRRGKRKPPRCLYLRKRISRHSRPCRPQGDKKQRPLFRSKLLLRNLSAGTGVNDLSDKPAPRVCAMKPTVT